MMSLERSPSRSATSLTPGRKPTPDPVSPDTSSTSHPRHPVSPTGT
jgi:hypothetical protein